jgi:hypothetical protein
MVSIRGNWLLNCDVTSEPEVSVSLTNQRQFSAATKTYLYIHICIRIVGGGVQLGPLGTSATNCPIVPAPGDYEDGEFGGMMIGRGNRSTRRKPTPVPLCPPQIPYALPGRELWLPRWEASD